MKASLVILGSSLGLVLARALPQTVADAFQQTETDPSVSTPDTSEIVPGEVVPDGTNTLRASDAASETLDPAELDQCVAAIEAQLPGESAFVQCMCNCGGNACIARDLVDQSLATSVDPRNDPNLPTGCQAVFGSIDSSTSLIDPNLALTDPNSLATDPNAAFIDSSSSSLSSTPVLDSDGDGQTDEFDLINNNVLSRMGIGSSSI